MDEKEKKNNHRMTKKELLSEIEGLLNEIDNLEDENSSLWDLLDELKASEESVSEAISKVDWGKLIKVRDSERHDELIKYFEE